jgi:hypothetical protein
MSSVRNSYLLRSRSSSFTMRLRTCALSSFTPRSDLRGSSAALGLLGESRCAVAAVQANRSQSSSSRRGYGLQRYNLIGWQTSRKPSRP